MGFSNAPCPGTHAKLLQEEKRKALQPYWNCMIAGGIGGSTGDFLLHSLDTVKTRQQGDTNIQPRHAKLLPMYRQIWRQEGFRGGLYGGWAAAMLGSLPGTMIFFGTYEACKRNMLDLGITPQVAYLVGGLLGDLAASFIYVPSEVLKTRLQLQGRYNNPFSYSGYNYKSTRHAFRTILRTEGLSAFYHGYRATMSRDLPFSALQFLFYEQGRIWARRTHSGSEIGLPLEMLTGAVAGGLAGAITCPLDVVKTRIQTRPPLFSDMSMQMAESSKVAHAALKDLASKKDQSRTLTTWSQKLPRSIANVSVPDTTSITVGLRLLYEQEGVAGCFRGLGPRLVWTGIQSGCMLFLYQAIMRQLELHA